MSASAQSLSSVSGAEVVVGDTSAEYRIGVDPESDGNEQGFAHRLHVQHSFDDTWRFRVFAVQSARGGEALRTKSVTFEVQNQFFEARDHGGWTSSWRFEGVLSTDDAKPSRIRGSWLNQIDSGPLQIRANIYLSRDVGENARAGLGLETREEATFKIRDHVRVGAQMFNNYNTTAAPGTFNTQRHQIGPVAKIKISKHLRLEASALYGLSAAAPDQTYRLFLSYAL